MAYRFSARSAKNLAGVHPELVAVMALALAESDLDFMITEGLRTEDRQRELVNKGASQTMNSRHLTGHAVDVAVLVEKGVAKRLNVPLTWGGDWKTLRDGPHYELHRDHYSADDSAPDDPECECCGQPLP